MFYVPLAVVTWLLSPRLIDRRRLPSLLVFGLLGSVLATVQDRLVLSYPLWEYRDSAVTLDHAQVALVISLSAAPIFGMRFAQGLVPGGPIPWLRILRYTAISMLPECVGLYTGHIIYHAWWNVGWSVVAYLPIWLSFWLLHRVLVLEQKPATHHEPISPQETTAPGV